MSPVNVRAELLGESGADVVPVAVAQLSDCASELRPPSPRRGLRRATPPRARGRTCARFRCSPIPRQRMSAQPFKLLNQGEQLVGRVNAVRAAASTLVGSRQLPKLPPTHAASHARRARRRCARRGRCSACAGRVAWVRAVTRGSLFSPWSSAAAAAAGGPTEAFAAPPEIRRGRLEGAGSGAAGTGTCLAASVGRDDDDFGSGDADTQSPLGTRGTPTQRRNASVGLPSALRAMDATG